MRVSPTLAIFALATSTIACATLAWQQYQRAEALAARAEQAEKAAATEPPPIQRTDEETVALTEEPDSEPATAVPAARDDRTAPKNRREPREDPGRRLNALMEQPEFASAFQVQQKARLDERYAALFRKLNLSPAQLEQLKNLLADR